MANTNRHNTDAMQRYESEELGTFFIHEDGELIFDEDGVAIGYICNRGSQYVVALVDDDLQDIGVRVQRSGVAETEDDELHTLMGLRVEYDEKVEERKALINWFEARGIQVADPENGNLCLRMSVEKAKEIVTTIVVSEAQEEARYSH